MVLLSPVSLPLMFPRDADHSLRCRGHETFLQIPDEPQGVAGSRAVLLLDPARGHRSGFPRLTAA
jgi:hypothetical protein